MGCCFCLQENNDLDLQCQPSQLNSVKHEDNCTHSSPQKMIEHAKNGEAWKRQGNDQFKNKNYTLAIHSYKQAIAQPDPDIIYFSNLALAYKANGQYLESIGIIDQMTRNPTFKTHRNADIFRKGQVIKSRSIIILVKEYCLKGQYSKEENTNQLKLIEAAISTLEEMLNAPNTQQEFKGFLQNGVKVKQFLTDQIIPKSKSQITLEYFEKKLTQINMNRQKESILFSKYYKSSLHILQDLHKFVQQDKLTVLQQQHDFITDPITYQTFKNPVIVPSGQSYDEDILRQHFKNNGYNDPITHQVFQLGEKVVVRNNSLKQFVKQIKKSINKQDLLYLNY